MESGELKEALRQRLEETTRHGGMGSLAQKYVPVKLYLAFAVMVGAVSTLRAEEITDKRRGAGEATEDGPGRKITTENSLRGGETAGSRNR